MSSGKSPEEVGIINQKGLNRKVVTIAVARLSQIFICGQHIFDSVKASLKRLQVDYIDLLQCEYFGDLRGLLNSSRRFARP